MPVVTLPDGSTRTFDRAVSVLEIAQSIGPGLAKATLAGRVNDKLVDASFVVTSDSHIEIVTGKSPEGLEIIRHSTAHLLAHAVKSLFPSAQVTIGPVVENGFFYDFAFERPFTPEDLERIESKMIELSKSRIPIARSEWSRDEAVAFFRNQGERYKAEIIEGIPNSEALSVYAQGDFTDLCRGPHVPDTGCLQAFKLTKVAGAYWRGDAKNEMLQRIYGTAWNDRKELEGYLKKIEEAEKRDHRKIGKSLGLFHVQEEAPGMVFWHPNGWTLWQVIEQYMRRVFTDNGYLEIRTPIIVARTLWEQSGHWEKFSGEMFTTESESHDFAVKPMNCPCHVQVYNQGLKSYRDLPLRLAEFGSCHRNELSGALHGLMRVRGFTQDDAHIFCTEDQIQAEVTKFIGLLFSVYKDFGFEKVSIKLSTRPTKRVGSDEVWDKAELALQTALDSLALPWTLQPGEGAFYGPKIEFSLQDCLDRHWQCGTIQVDFSMPERLGAAYVAEDSCRKTPVILHRAILGSMERFIGILVEHYAGRFPLWLAPIQVSVLTITDRQNNYATQLADTLRGDGFRVSLDLRNEKIGFKIREHTLQHVPFMLVLGDKEEVESSASVRTRCGKDLGSVNQRELAESLRVFAADI